MDWCNKGPARGPPTFKDVQEGRLTYTQRVVKESLRKYAPINLFPRLARARLSHVSTLSAYLEHLRASQGE